MSLLLIIAACLVAYFFHLRIRRLEERVDRLSAGNTFTEKSISRTEQETTAMPQPMERMWSAPVPPPGYSEATETPVAPKEEIPAQPMETREERSARILGRVGAIAILLGVSFFLKYAFDNDWIPPALRVVLGIVAGLAMVGVGHYLRNKDLKYLRYSDILFGGGLGVLYLSVYASFGFYHLLGAPVAFFLMILVTTLGLALSVTGNSLGLAGLATMGGFLTPVLLSTGENHLATLSVYMLILDLGVFGIALWKKWPQLNMLTFFGTIFLFSGWYTKFYYTAPQLGETFLFVTLFYLTFLATSIVHHFVRKEPSTPKDLFLLVANAAVYFCFSSTILDPSYHDLLGFFALVLSVLYLVLSYATFAANSTDRTLNLFLPGIAIVFLTVAIPLQFSGYFVTVSWLVEAVILVATGLYLKERVIQMFGWIVLVIGLMSVGQDVQLVRSCRDQFGKWNGLTNPSYGRGACVVTPFLNTGFFLMMLGVTALYAMAGLYYRFRNAMPEGRSVALFALVAANLLTPLALSAEFSLGNRFLISFVWFIESIFLLVLGLRFKQRSVEILAWILFFVGLAVLIGHVDDIRRGALFSGGHSTELIRGFYNFGFFLLLTITAVLSAMAALYVSVGGGMAERKRTIAVVILLANLSLLITVTSEISFKYNQDIGNLNRAAAQRIQEDANYFGNRDPYYNNYRNAYYGQDQSVIAKTRSLENSKNTAITIFWTIYALLLLTIGFAKRIPEARIFGLILFFVVAVKVFLDVWKLGQIYRIVSSIIFGVIALVGSFLYVRYKERLKDIIYNE